MKQKNLALGLFYKNNFEQTFETTVWEIFWCLDCYVVKRPLDKMEMMDFYDLTIQCKNTLQSILG